MIPCSDRFRLRFTLSLSSRYRDLDTFLKRIEIYAKEFITPADSFKLRYKDTVILVDRGVLVNCFRLPRG